mmetsp:Transcript_16062/g.34729  ORF Transcript_16062/g.34729 Transcript_16062/m.34729 type:complete len:808 (-) Transcript_16062:84-2507(-)|eukprot:CAMPEP_0206459256 /NCGR_PEP_ID=MMETSP0324_2-20121206/24070_1 /ASSEMBLY_ACC=CAM_ASM_000836 /TAXON_ID=2866 /ORGANISM="Crypthecodinium cohnii, Strain Seligo" /LENGTH=807 /DNA_ID=CAMNT_0053930777 /DNA_START=375 /DNA_END=2798 /DNA_ORIENTATION=-
MYAHSDLSSPLRQPSIAIVGMGRQTVEYEITRGGVAFPGWGTVYDEPPPPNDDLVSLRGAPHKKLGQLASTAICGNDITGSCFYVTGALAAAAGVWAPIAAVLASATLWLFRWVYTEAVTALPFNGGIYNVLLNTVRNKRIAGMVATLTMLSYLATCVVSALSAGHYLQTLIDKTKNNPMEEGCYVIQVSVGLIVFFAVLKIIGISESAKVAAVLFVVHLLVMAVLMVATFVSIALPTTGIPFGRVVDNLKINTQYTGQGGIASKITFGFANAMLGVSGFESSANFVEEQEEGVFPKTLRNMWWAVSILNIVFITECIFATDLHLLVAEEDNSLAYLGRVACGPTLEKIVSIDAFLNLASAVLTSFVGIGGLASRMAGDRCLPKVFDRGDKLTTIIFMSLCISLVLILKGDSQKLAACYSFAFLTVMFLFALSLFVLQVKRPKLPRAMKNNLLIPFLAASLCIVALISAMYIHKEVLDVFAMYLLLLAGTVGTFMYRLRVLKALRKLFENCACTRSMAKFCDGLIQKVKAESSVVYFTKTANISRLNKAILYIRANEDTNFCRIVHVHDDEEDPEQRERLELFIGLLDSIYPSVRIDMVFVKGRFGASMIEHLSTRWQVAPALMFMNCPRSEVPGQRLKDLRGVRVIMGHEDEAIDEFVDAIATRERFTSFDKQSPSMQEPLASSPSNPGLPSSPEPLNTREEHIQTLLHSWTAEQQRRAREASGSCLSGNQSPRDFRARSTSNSVPFEGALSGPSMLGGTQLAEATSNGAGLHSLRRNDARDSGNSDGTTANGTTGTAAPDTSKTF